MRNKLRFSVIISALIFALIPFSAIKANAMTFEMRIPSFGLYCDNENAIVQGNVKYVIDENGKAVQYSEYSVNKGTFYIPFIASLFNIPNIDFDLQYDICYGEPISFNNDYKYAFYSSDLNGMTGTVYTLNTASESFTVDFTMLEHQNCICRLTQGSRINKDSKHFSCTINDARTDIPYEVYILNGDCAEFESSAQITKETVTVKEYIDRQFDEFKDYLSAGGQCTPTPHMLYALANQAVANNINYDYFDFFTDSFTQMRLNAYKIEIQDPCTISYSMSVDVQKNSSFNPAIYLTEQTATGSYAVDYTIELNGEFPFIIENSTSVEKQGDYVYTVKDINEDFYFVFSSSEKPTSMSTNTYNRNKTVLIICGVVGGVGLIWIAVFIGITLYRRK